MKKQLYAVVNPETKNVIAIFCNVEDAISLAAVYEERNGNTYHIEDVTKFGAHEMIDRDWVDRSEYIEMKFGMEN